MMKTPIAHHLATLIAVVFLSAATGARAATYYVDAAAGKDEFAGTSPATAWSSLAKVNATTFQPGDTLLFKAGGVWKGVLHPLGAGTSAAHIRIDSYGPGNKPLINGRGAEAAVYLLNQPYWEIRNLEVTNTGKNRGEYVGIMVRNDSGGPLNYAYIGSCRVHDVNGVTAGYYGKNAGIAVVADMNGSTWNDVMIENNEISRVDRIGIMVGPTVQLNTPNQWILLPKSANITIQNNAISDSGGDGILNFVTHNTLIQHNVVADCGGRASDGSPNTTSYTNKYSAGIWSAIATKTVIQYNEVYGERTTFDGQGYDVDLGSDDIVVQYNYSHHNQGGFLLFCESGSKADINNAKIRFNVSHDDRRGIFVICQSGLSPAPIVPEINNNTIYIPAGSNTPMFIFSEGALRGKMNIYNNIFCVLGTTSYCAFDGAVFDHNLFYGDHPDTEPADAHKLTADPKFVAPGTGMIGRASSDGYKLQAGSPALGSGRYSTAEVMGTQDYWGNPVLPDVAPNCGAYNGPGIAGVVENFAFNATVTTLSSSEHGTWSKTNVVDGQTQSVLGTSGYSSELGRTTDHTEWIALDFGGKKTFSKVTLFPRTTPGFEGKGFPRSFQIQTWDGAKWVTRATIAKYANPGSSPRTFTLSPAETSDRIRLYCTHLDQLGTDFVLQLAEIRVEP